MEDRKLRSARLAPHRTKGRHHDHVGGKRKGVGGLRKNISQRGMKGRKPR
jgi:hypothetical protein